MAETVPSRFLFPRWSNKVVPIAIFFVLGPLSTAAIAAIWYYGTDKNYSVGYEPKQPVEYSHKLHAGDLGIDCRYCHFTAERSYMAAVPPAETCMNCHWTVKTNSLQLLPIRESYASNQPIPWVRVHNLPDFVYFNHSAHLAAGVGCSTCHGRIDQMARVRQAEPLTMGWCLDCHRNPAPYLRTNADLTNMAWQPNLALEDAHPESKMADNHRKLSPPTHCSGCHR
jgi:hypothetical protein